MSQYVIKLNDDDVIISQDVDLASTYCDVVFKIKQDGLTTINLRGLTFGFMLKKAIAIVHIFSYPPSGVKLLKSNMPYICTERVNWTPNDYYTIDFWIKQSGKDTIARTYDFLTIKPTSPSPSCVWNNNKKEFEYPKQMPVDGKEYDWDERSKSWIPACQYLSSVHHREGR